MKCRVLKLGGSLLNLPDVVSRLANIVASYEGTSYVVVGGGAIADAVRTYDDRFQLSPDSAHKLALHAMDLNARLLAEIAPQFHLTETPTLNAANSCFAQIILVSSVLAELENGMADNLPRSWNVTSDSIAAWIADRWGADLVLLKSMDVPASIHEAKIEAMVEREYVDRHFTMASSGVSRIGWCNLRSAEPLISWLD